MKKEIGLVFTGIVLGVLITVTIITQANLNGRLKIAEKNVVDIVNYLKAQQQKAQAIQPVK
jgi:hypothetical protein